MTYPEISLPKMVKVRQTIPAPRVVDYLGAVREELRRSGLSELIKPGDRVAITAGSRGVVNIAQVLATVVDEVKKVGASSFLVNAMGSHGGATVEGQLMILKDLGITEESVGAPIIASMDVEEIGRFESGRLIYVDRNAYHADAIIVVNRVKPHTDFKGEFESGLMKMLVIGLGHQKGAEAFHTHGVRAYAELLPSAAKEIMKKAPVKLGLAIVENAYHEIAYVKAMRMEEIEDEEKLLLERAKSSIARIPFKELDVLVVKEIGKNISGLGMDTNVVGRFPHEIEEVPRLPKISRIVVLDLIEESHGNALGIGLADLTTRRLVEKIDHEATQINAITSCRLDAGKIPIALPNDRDVIYAALRTCGANDLERARLMIIKNTLELDTFLASESLLGELEGHKDIRILDGPFKIQFDDSGRLLDR